MKREIIEGNKRIAEFMGWKVSETHRQPPYNSDFFWVHPTMSPKLTKDTLVATTLDQMRFNSSWDWLMPVVEKIEGCLEGCPVFHIKDTRAHIEPDTQLSMVFEMDYIPQCYSGFCENKITATYSTVIQFITWYNNQLICTS